MSITIINYGTLNLDGNEQKTVEQAKDELLTKLYHARYKSTFGGYDAWLALLSMYYAFEYRAMYAYITACQGMGGKTRSECLALLKIIMEENKNDD